MIFGGISQFFHSLLLQTRRGFRQHDHFLDIAEPDAVVAQDERRVQKVLRLQILRGIHEAGKRSENLYTLLVR